MLGSEVGAMRGWNEAAVLLMLRNSGLKSFMIDSSSSLYLQSYLVCYLQGTRLKRVILKSKLSIVDIQMR